MDHDVLVIGVRDPARKLRGIVFGYACHATVLNDYQINGDWPGRRQFAVTLENRQHTLSMARDGVICILRSPLPLFQGRMRVKRDIHAFKSCAQRTGKRNHLRLQNLVWRFGGAFTLVALAGEVVVDYSLRLRAQHGWNNVWVASYSNDVFAYIPSLRVLKEGGYEGSGAMISYGQPGPFAPAVEETIVHKVDQMIKRTAAK